MRKLILIICLSMTVAVLAAASDGIPDNCEYEGGAYERRELFVRYDRNNERLVLVDWTTADIVHVLQTDLRAIGLTFIGWSPDCRYVMTVVDPSEASIWDTTTGARIARFAEVTTLLSRSARRSLAYVDPLVWSPDMRYVLIQSNDGALLWDRTTNQQHALNTRPNANGYSFHRVGWDLERGMLLGVPTSALDTVAAYDLASGARVASYDVVGATEPVAFFTSGDQLVAFHQRDSGSGVFAIQRITVWNRATNSVYRADPFIWLNRREADQIAVSPDGRYLAIGVLRIRVFDTTQPDRLEPTYNYDGEGSYITQLSFVDNTTLETIDQDGLRYRWDLHTGAPLAAD